MSPTPSPTDERERADALEERRTDLCGLDIRWDRRVLQPRPWTAEQGHWIGDLAADAPPGRILELCSGAGHIGLVAATDSGRDLTQVDRDPVAVAYARRNAAAAGVDSDVRQGDLSEVLLPGETFPLVLADPPWLPTESVDDFPDDPVGAVDGGVDGMEIAVHCLRVALQHLSDGGHLVLQVGRTSQVERLAEELDRLRRDGARPEPFPVVRGIRDCRPGGVLVHIGPDPGVEMPESNEHDQQHDRQDDQQDDQQDEQHERDTDGQVSEVGSFDGAGETIFPDQAVAGYPLDDDEGGRGVQEGAAGPEAPPRDDDRGRR